VEEDTTWNPRCVAIKKKQQGGLMKKKPSANYEEDVFVYDF
jgi:hypothetical protein